MKKSTIINITAALCTFIVQIFISFWLSPFVVSKLGEEAYGFINLANNFVSYASLITVMINSMASRYISVEYNSGRKDSAKKYYSTVYIINCWLFALIIVFAILLISQLEKIINITPALIFQVKITFLLSFINMGASLLGTVYTSAAFSSNKMHYNSIIQIISNVSKSVLIFILFSFLPSKIFYFSIATLIAGFITLIGNYWVAKKIFFDFKIKREDFSIQRLIILIKSGVWVFISNISNLLLNGLDLLLSNWFLSNIIMGRLSLAKQIPYALSSALGIFSNIFSSSQTKVLISDGENGLIEETKSQLKILTLIFTVPFAGIIAFGIPFLNLWLQNANYDSAQIFEIYILMILILIDIIASTYMYSIHSVFIALDKIKSYSILLFVASIISIALTVLLLKCTNYGEYIISGTSTIVLGITHGIIVPAMAAKLLKKPISTFWKTESKSWALLGILTSMYYLIAKYFNMFSWKKFTIYILIFGALGYICSFIFLFNKKERKKIFSIFSKKI